jgi:branched-chain amino acid transport system permease protein
MFEYVIRGLINGAVYGILALPMSLLFATAGTVDFAIGAYALIAAAVATSVAGTLGLVAGVLSALLASAVMAAIFALLKRSGEEGIRVALASFGLSVAIASIVLLIWGTQPFVRPSFTKMLEIDGLRINPQGLINVTVSVGHVALTYYLLRATSLGRMMRAAAANPVGAELAAIPVLGVQCGTILAGGLLGGIAGLMILHSAGLDFTASLSLTFIGFAAAIIFGIETPLRSLLGGLTMGVVEALSAGYTSGMITSMIPSAFMLAVLMTGLLGANRFAGDRP